MTMPHLMNCSHQDSGWCIECVKQLHGKAEELVAALETLLKSTHYSTPGYRDASYTLAKYKRGVS